LSNSSTLFSGRGFFKWLALAVGFAVAVSLAPQMGGAETASPWAKFLGNWRGTGEVIDSDGTREHISCRGKYSASSEGEALTLSVRCASDSYSFDIGSYLVATGNSVSGDWQEYSRKIEGHVTGRVGDGLLEGSIAGTSFTAETTVRISGRKQTLSLRTKGAQAVRAEVSLTREN
jgi:hypothetical protein